jgi:hypothetical protein
MKPELKHPFESALVAAVVAFASLWMLVSSAQLEEVPVTRIVLFAFVLAGALGTHLVFMLQLVRRTGRSVALWLAALVLLAPLSSAVLLIQIASE